MSAFYSFGSNSVTKKNKKPRGSNIFKVPVPVYVHRMEYYFLNIYITEIFFINLAPLRNLLSYIHSSPLLMFISLQMQYSTALLDSGPLSFAQEYLLQQSTETE